MMEVYIQQITSNQRPLLVGDHSAWFRPDAVTLQERTHEHKPSRIGVNKPIGVGFGYSTIAYVPEDQGSWTLPLLHERINSSETAISKLSEQLTQVCPQLDQRAIVVVDSQYGCASFVQQTTDIPCDKLMRLSSNRCLLAWHGEQMPTLIELVKLYLRRFTIEHWYRFAKQRLHWTLPNLGTKEQCDRWSDLMPMMTWELWLARDIIVDNPLPWQKSQVNLTPGRVAQSFGTVIAMIGTPASSPKPRGKSPGWRQGRIRAKKIRYPIIKKGKGRFESQKKAKEESKSA